MPLEAVDYPRQGETHASGPKSGDDEPAFQPPGLPADSAVLDSLAEIGSRLFGMPVTIHAGDSQSPVVTGGFPPPSRGFRHTHPLLGADGCSLGAISLVDLKSHPPLDEAQIHLLEGLGSIAGGYMGARQALGSLDHVTLLPNRQQFVKDASRIRANADLAKLGHTILLVTLADARMFNELLRALGHGYADDFVKSGASLLRQAIARDIALYHVSVLSFAVVIPTQAGAEEKMARQIAGAFSQAVMCRGVPIATRVGIGLARLKMSSNGTDESLRAALTAAQDSRQCGEGWARYSKATDDAQRRAFQLLGHFRHALEQPGQLALNFQPRVLMKSGACMGVEALLRWTHPEFGPISPGEFIPLVETTAMINPLTQWVLRHGICQIGEWQRDGLDLCLALNVSPNNLREKGFARRLRRMLDDEGVGPHRIELEFTEGALTTNEPVVNAEIQAIGEMGVEIAIDDFGTGYSNLNYLTRLSAQIVKIDQSFVRTMASQPRQQLLVRSITDMAHALGFRVVAEGIETRETFDMLQAWGCEEGQGYLISRPLSEADFRRWAHAGNAFAVA